MADFDEHAQAYDSWFFDNQNLLTSELKLVKHFLQKDSEILSIGCGSGLFEMLLKKEYDIEVKYGVEPSEGMAKIARQRGMEVEICKAENMNLDLSRYDVIMFNGSPSYIKNFQICLEKAYMYLKPEGKIVVIDVPKEGSYGTLYGLAKTLGTWEHPLLKDVSPDNPYPIELVKAASWRTTNEKINMMSESGFQKFEFAQTLLTHPIFSNKEIQEPIEGYDKGDYVAICAYKTGVR